MPPTLGNVTTVYEARNWLFINPSSFLSHSPLSSERLESAVVPAGVKVTQHTTTAEVLWAVGVGELRPKLI